MGFDKKAYNKVYSHTHYKERRKQYNEGNREQYNKRNRERNLRIRNEMLEAYGGKCVNCGVANRDLLDLDHINDDGYLDRHRSEHGRTSAHMPDRLRKLGFPKDRYQLLCKNCNWLKELERRRRPPSGPPVDLEDLGLL